MAGKDHQIKNRVWMFFLIIFIDMLSNGLIDSSGVSNPKIEGSEDDIINCIDIYKQPAFSHPFLKNHTIQMKPNSGGLRERNNTKLLQEWNKKARCPEGTILILKAQTLSNEHKVTSVLSKRRQSYSNFHVFDVNSGALKYYQFIINYGTYFGASRGFNIWHPTIHGEEFSSSQMWVQVGYGHDLNSLEAGWRDGFQVLSDINKKIGCYNLECPGFVQTNNKIALSYDILPISIYGGKQYDTEITIFKGWPSQLSERQMVERSSLLCFAGDKSGRSVSQSVWNANWPGCPSSPSYAGTASGYHLDSDHVVVDEGVVVGERNLEEESDWVSDLGKSLLPNHFLHCSCLLGPVHVFSDDVLI
ncbi:uncharacterized protein LOC122722235 [Manihot esculenta]|uniref:uncharacterized protein LOC122722235 n=1 Tax=Manihot esculenta TaxID=3983 RepID=UPI001CC3F592|nr:uncharacterized protein LOC122722235 [Manihot esculenta]